MILNDFTILAAALKHCSGLVLQHDQAYLLEARLTPLLQHYQFADWSQLARHLQRQRDEALVHAMAEAMTVNETSFMRDTKPFDVFRRQILPDLLKRNAATRRIRLWSAGCAGGQEAYSLAMLLAEENLFDWRVEIFGTDLSRRIIDYAEKGSYSQFEIQRGLPVQMMLKYFAQNDERWHIHAGLRRIVSFQKQNLLDDFSALGFFDMIFCRNVLLYMDQPAKQDILTRMTKNAHRDTLLVLGASETLLQLNVPWRGTSYLPNIYGIN